MLWAIGLGFVAVTVGFAVAFVRSQRGSKTPASPIGEAAESVPVVIRGTVATPAPLRGPCSGRECAYYRVELRGWSGNQIETSMVSDRVDFSVRDETGKARVLVERASFEIVADIFETGRASQLATRRAR